MIVNNAKFKKAMAVVENARENRNTIPILGTIRATLATTDLVTPGLRLEATDLDMTVTATCPVEAICEQKVAVDQFLISDPRAGISAINAAGGSEVTLVAAKPGKDEKGVDHRLAIQSGDLKLSQATGDNPEDFPGSGRVVETLFSAEMSSDTLKQIARLFPAISTEETRYYLNGVNMKKLEESGWTYRFAATDGHRLFVIDIPLPGATGDQGDVILPRRFIDAVAKELGKSKDAIQFKLGHAAASNGKPLTSADGDRRNARCSIFGKIDVLEVSFDGKLIDGTFPDYSRVIPTAVPRSANFDIRTLRRAVTAVSAAYSSKSHRAIKLVFDATGVTISKSVGQLGANDASFRVECQHNCEGMTAGFNGKYLLEALNSFSGEEVNLAMEEPAASKDDKRFMQVAGPTLIRDPADTAFFVVLMPMRV